MKIIYKYEVPLKKEFTLSLPAGAQVLCCQVQNSVPHIWVILDTIKPQETRQFSIYGTGEPIPKETMLSYIGTFQLNGGGYIGHLFENMT